MNVKKILIPASIVVVMAVLVFGYFKIAKQDSPGRVLGASINSYKDKLITPTVPPRKKTGVKDPYIAVQSAILITDDGKYTLFEKNARSPVPIASVTKIMTALVATDLYKSGDIIEMKTDYVDPESSVIGLKKGEKMTFVNLLYGLFLNSGNDAALAISAGKTTEAGFIDLMNKKARKLGLTDSLFKDPAGLNDEGRSSAHDVALTFSQVLKNELLLKIIGTSEYSITSSDGQFTHQLKNSNRLVTGEIPLDGVVGGKTGFTYEAGHTLVCAATKDNQTLISVVLKTYSDTKPASAEQTKRLLQWGFDSFDFSPQELK